jgi:hypothetical protein
MKVESNGLKFIEFGEMGYGYFPHWASETQISFMIIYSLHLLIESHQSFVWTLKDGISVYHSVTHEI